MYVINPEEPKSPDNPEEPKSPDNSAVPASSRIRREMAHATSKTSDTPVTDRYTRRSNLNNCVSLSMTCIRCSRFSSIWLTPRAGQGLLKRQAHMPGL